jgi:hypothetical protein
MSFEVQRKIEDVVVKKIDVYNTGITFDNISNLIKPSLNGS